MGDAGQDVNLEPAADSLVVENGKFLFLAQGSVSQITQRNVDVFYSKRYLSIVEFELQSVRRPPRQWAVQPKGRLRLPGGIKD